MTYELINKIINKQIEKKERIEYENLLTDIKAAIENLKENVSKYKFQYIYNSDNRTTDEPIGITYKSYNKRILLVLDQNCKNKLSEENLKHKIIKHYNSMKYDQIEEREEEDISKNNLNYKLNRNVAVYKNFDNHLFPTLFNDNICFGFRLYLNNYFMLKEILDEFGENNKGKINFKELSSKRLSLDIELTDSYSFRKEFNLNGTYKANLSIHHESKEERGISFSFIDLDKTHKEIESREEYQKVILENINILEKIILYFYNNSK